MAGIYGRHFGLIREGGREEVVVGIGLRPEELAKLASQLALAEREAGSTPRSIKAIENTILTAARRAAVAAVARRQRRLARLEVKLAGKGKPAGYSIDIQIGRIKHSGGLR